MDSISEKVRQWIASGKDPRSAHWQAGLEAMMDLFDPYLDPGRLVPLQPLEDKDIPIYKAILETADLSPNLKAAFLPPSMAGSIKPPESAEEIKRIEDGKPSYKILVVRPGREGRILCAEISPHAEKPGADIFQSGALLGTYDYPSHEECVSGLTQTLRSHLWTKGKWSKDEHQRYTLNWFEKVMRLHSNSVPVDHNSSYLHSPTLIKADKIAAIFLLITDYLDKRLNASEGDLHHAVFSLKNMEDKKEQNTLMTELVESSILECLNLMRDFKIVNFSEFTNKESDQFKVEFSRTTAGMIGKIQNNP
ncbi:MAG: hypothetical protein FP816_05845 [Desulfobacteraceae bacterium]|nr:hypothetical protein [Desulfobacteraceae bacterium]MBU4002139.1 hypothetical protein [Pseudomonadota bacterium]MBU4054851.1 hypothetical protein [Pseudomonadota bacterium]